MIGVGQGVRRGGEVTGDRIWTPGGAKSGSHRSRSPPVQAAGRRGRSHRGVGRIRVTGQRGRARSRSVRGRGRRSGETDQPSRWRRGARRTVGVLAVWASKEGRATEWVRGCRSVQEQCRQSRGGQHVLIDSAPRAERRAVRQTGSGDAKPEEAAHRDVDYRERIYMIRRPRIHNSRHQ